MNKLTTDEIVILIEYLEDFMKAIYINESSDHIQDAVHLDNMRDSFKEFLISLVREAE